MPVIASIISSVIIVDKIKTSDLTPLQQEVLKIFKGLPEETQEEIRKIIKEKVAKSYFKITNKDRICNLHFIVSPSSMSFSSPHLLKWCNNTLLLLIHLMKFPSLFSLAVKHTPLPVFL